MVIRPIDLQERLLPRRLPSRMRSMPTKDDLQEGLGSIVRNKGNQLR